MWRVIRSSFLASVILFGASAASAVDGFAQEFEEVDEATCGGDYDPICRMRTRERCTKWDPCAPLQFCCTRWEKTTVHDYFREPGDEWESGGIYN